VLADECEAIGNNFQSGTRYHQLLNQYPDARIIGFTATPHTLQEGQIGWGKIIHEITYQTLLDGGYCTPLTNKICDNPDLSEVKHTGAEFNLVALGEHMRQNDLVQSAAKKTAEYIRQNNRKKTLGFCVDLEHAYQMALALKQYGLNADMVSGDMDEVQREMHYNDFEHGDTEVLLNVEILTKGADFPCIDCIAMYRPTDSMRLYFQMLGRSIRLYEGKTHALLLDFTGNLKKFGTLGNPIWKYFGSEKKKVGKAQKCCPACESSINIGRETCPDCGYIFLKEDIEKELKHEAEADLQSDMSKAKSVERIYTIGHIEFSEHTSAKGGKSLRVQYHSGRFSCNQFVPFGNPQYWAKKRVQEFMRGRSNVIPTTLEAALKLAPTWRKPKVMRFMPQKDNPKYFEVEAILEWQSEEI
jgi:DNA repair protein RadD